MFRTLDVTETYVNVKIKADYRGFVEPSPFVMVLLWVKPSGVLEDGDRHSYSDTRGNKASSTEVRNFVHVELNA